MGASTTASSNDDQLNPPTSSAESANGGVSQSQPPPQSPNLDEAQAEFQEYSVSTPLLLQVKLPIANSKCSSNDFFTINEEKQMCAGGVKGTLSQRKISPATP